MRVRSSQGGNCILADDRGAAVVEFALIIPVLTVILLGFLDFAHWSYVRAATNGALERVARAAAVGETTVNTADFQDEVEDLITEIAESATFTWQAKSYYQFSGVGKPEKLTTDNNGNKSYDAGDCWEDLQANGVYDTNPGRTGIGGADDIVFYKVTIAYNPLVPGSELFSWMVADHTVTASTIVKRQPYAAQTVPAIRC